MSLIDILLGKRPVDRRPAPLPITHVSRRNPKGRKRWKMMTADGYEVLTPWAAKERRRRRAADKVAKQARKRNRRYRTTGGLR